MSVASEGLTEASSRTQFPVLSRRRIELGAEGYDYYYGDNCVPELVGALLGLGADRLIVVTDTTVMALHGESLVGRLKAAVPTDLVILPVGEQAKSTRLLAEKLDDVILCGATRESLVVAFGGGVPGNVAGVMAGLLFRGIRLAHVPTTTMAAMDSTISLKQAINGCGKNLIGLYHQPCAVYLDFSFLSTLPARELRSGLGEAVKNCLAIRPGSIASLEALLGTEGMGSAATMRWLLDDSIAAKTQVMAQDHRERRSGLVLEYGHTVGHAVELCDRSVRGTAALSHGESVALGMRIAARLAQHLGGRDDAMQDAHTRLLDAIGAPRTLPSGVTTADVMRLVSLDNKRGYLGLAPDQAAFVLLDALGNPFTTDGLPLTAVPLSTVATVLDEFAGPCAAGHGCVK